MSNPAYKDESEDDALFRLRNLARPLGLWVGVHKYFDPVRGRGVFFVTPRKEFPEQKTRMLRRYATTEQVKNFLEHEADHYAD